MTSAASIEGLARRQHAPEAAETLGITAARLKQVAEKLEQIFAS